MNKTLTDHTDKARSIWATMNASEQHGVRFGLFPAPTMEAADKEGYDGHTLVCCLMNLAQAQPQPPAQKPKPRDAADRYCQLKAEGKHAEAQQIVEAL